MPSIHSKSTGICNERGIALILVLLVIGALSVIILNINYTTRVNIHLSENFRDETKAYFLARGAVEGAIYWLKEDESKYDALCEAGDLTCENEWSLDNPGMEVGDGFVELKIRDEDGKIYINDTKNNHLFNDNANKTSHSQLLLSLKDGLYLDDDVFDSIQDWIDKNEDVFDQGAEEDYYSSLEQPYDIRNGPLLEISELLLIKGIDDKIYFGKNDDYPVGLKDIFTVYSEGKINVNTAPAKVLTALGTDIDGDEIADYRRDTPFETLTDFTTYIKQGQGSFYVKNPASLLVVKSTYFSAYVKVQVHKVTKFVHAVLKREQKSGKVIVSIVFWREE